MSRPTFILVGGSNGAGKSTLTSYYNRSYKFPIVDPDAIAREAQSNALIAHGKTALRNIDRLLASKKSFIAETTLSGKNYLNILAKSKDLGYRTELVYVCLNSVEQAISRVQERVMQGGHHIPQETVRRRYQRSFDNLKVAMKIADRTKILENSKSTYSRVATLSRNSMTIYKKPNEIIKELQFLESYTLDKKLKVDLAYKPRGLSQ